MKTVLKYHIAFKTSQNITRCHNVALDILEYPRIMHNVTQHLRMTHNITLCDSISYPAPK